MAIIKYLFYLKHTKKRRFESIVSIKLFSWLHRCGPYSASKSSNCPTDIVKCVQKQLWYILNSWIKLLNSPCCCLILKIGWTQNLSFFSYLETSGSAHDDVNSIAFIMHFLTNFSQNDTFSVYICCTAHLDLEKFKFCLAFSLDEGL